jgi:hypothetical protein
MHPHQGAATPHEKPLACRYARSGPLVQWRAKHEYPLSKDDVAAKKRVEQEPQGKKNEINTLDSVNVWILLDSL